MDAEHSYSYQYPHPAVTTDCVVFGFDGEKLQVKVLLIQRGIDPFMGSWALPGGFMQMDEDADECARRELQEETHLETDYLAQFHTFSNPERDPRERVITIAYYALCKIKDVKPGTDAIDAQWFPIDEIQNIDLAFDHREILESALTKLREDIHFKPVGFQLLPEKFTMKELQTIYEAILDIKFDRGNFAKKMLHNNVVEKLDETVQKSSKRNALLYCFKKENYDILKEDISKLEF